MVIIKCDQKKGGIKIDKRFKCVKCPEEKEFWIKHYIKLGKSTIQIAKEFGFCRATVLRKVRKLCLLRSSQESKKNEKNPNWKGDKVGYMALHNWIKRRKPKPKFCEYCGEKEPYDLANISGEYKRDINDFEWLCRKCHMTKDGRIINNLRRYG